MRTLIEIHQREHGKVSDKWESYFRIYERLLKPLRADAIQLLEIGIQNGGSLEMWAQYFESAIGIYGCDIDQRCHALKFDDPRIKVIVGNCCTREVEMTIAGHSPSFDIIIDDGSHVSRDILSAFWIYFGRVKPGGLYIVEDTHALYDESYEGGILKRTSATEMFKLLADVVNYQHWRSELSLETLLSTFFSRANFPRFLLEGWVESVEFANSMIVVRKCKIPGFDLGRRLISGSEARVQPAVLRFRTEGPLSST